MIHLLFLIIISASTHDMMMLKSEHFNVVYDKEAEKSAKIAVEAAEKAYGSVKNHLGIEAEFPVMIRISRTSGPLAKDMQPTGRGDVPDWAVGLAYPKRRIIFIRSPSGQEMKYDDIAEVTTHEYTHVAMGNYLEDIETPRWLEEGVADFVGGKRSWTASITLGLSAIGGRLFSFEALTYQWPTSTSDAGTAYAQSADFVMFIERQNGPGAVKRLLAELKNRGKIDPALMAVTGKNLAQLQKDWYKKVSRLYRWIPLLTGGILLWAFASVLVIFGYIRKQKIKRIKYEMWELEDRMRIMGKHTPPALVDDEDDDIDEYVEENDDDDEPPENTTYH